MTAPTWADYPCTPYPPFKDPEDWRELVGGKVSDRDAQRVQQAVDGAKLDHYAKHDKRDHPWCVLCEGRRYDFETLVEEYEHLILSPAESQARTWAVVDEAGADGDSVKKVHKRLGEFVKAGWDVRPEDADTLADEFQLPRTVIDAVAADVENRESWEHEQQRRAYIVTSRAARYTVLHRGTLPIDTYDPEQDVDDQDADDDQYLDREQLADLPIPEPLIDGILSRHAYALLIGRDHTFKSFTALDWALCMATGKPWQASTVAHGRVLYVAGEGAYGITKRVDAWEYGWGHKVDPDRFTVRISAVNLYRGGPPLERLLARITEDEYDLVILDTLRRVSGGAEGNGSDMGVVVDNIDRVKKATANGSVLVLAHTGKDDHDARGFSGIEDDADIVWHAKAEGTALTLKNTKQKDQAEHHDLSLEMIPALDSLVIGAGDRYARPVSTESEAVLMVTMREHFSETGATSTQLLEASGVPKSTYYRARNGLLKQGLMIVSGTQSRPRYQLPESHQVPREETAFDLHVSHQSHEVPRNGEKGPTGPTPLIGGTRGTPASETTERTAS